MQKEPESLPPAEAYRENLRHRLRLRQLNFEHGGGGAQSGPRSAQIKAIQKFISRLRSDNKSYETILAELSGLNLTKYLEQISALMSVCINERDIRFFTEVATRLNTDYEDFPQMLLKDLNKQFTLAFDLPEDNKARLKSLLLFTTQLMVCGFPFPVRQVSDMLKKLVKVGTKKRNNFHTEKQLRLFAYYYNCDIYAAFLTCFGTIFTTATPRWMEKIEGGIKEQYPSIIPAKTREDFTRIFFTNYVSSCVGVLDAAFERLTELQQELRANLRLSGEFNKTVQANYHDLKEKFIFTKSQLAIIIDLLSKDIELRSYEDELSDVQDIMKKYINLTDNAEIFENQFEKQLYTELPEFNKPENKTAGEEEYKEFKQRLVSCKNKNQSDETIKAFETINNKRTRKMLAWDILEYRKEYQLVTPYLCRIATVIGLAHKDLAEAVLQAVFAQYQKLKESVNTSFVINDKKSRNLKYICEFTKFKLLEAEKTLGVLQNLIDDLKGYNIQLLISALESVGRFLYLSPQNANKFTFLLSKLENFMKQKSLPLFTNSQLVNSINLLKPHTEIQKPLPPPLTPVQEQASNILAYDVTADIQPIIKGICQLIKTDEGLEAIREGLMAQIERYDFLGSYNYAYLLDQLAIGKISDWVVEQTIIKLEESVRSGDYQSCLLWSRFLGELFKYQLLKRSFLFEKIYHFLQSDKNQIAVINLVCTIFQTCQGYLECKKVTTRNQLFLLLVQFKKYIHNCQYIPMLEQFKIVDVLDKLQPNLTEITMPTLTSFLQQHDSKSKPKQIDLSEALDKFLGKNHFKEEKEQVTPKDFRSTDKQPEPEDTSEERSGELLINQSNNFDSEFRTIMTAHIKDLSGKIAKPAFVEKVIERKKERKKVGEGEQKRTVIGRCGNKFVKKEVVFVATEGQKNQDNKNQQ